MNVQCGICKDLLNVCNIIVKSLPCGHVFHDNCIDTWMDKGARQTCPHCRKGIDKKRMVQLFLDLIPLFGEEDDPNVMRGIIADLKQEKMLLKSEVTKHSEKTRVLQNQMEGLRARVVSLESEIDSMKPLISLSNIHRMKLKTQTVLLEKATQDLDTVKRKYESLKAANTIFNSTLLDVKSDLENISSLEHNDLAMLAYSYKKDAQKLLKKQNEIINDMSKCQMENRGLIKSLEKLQAEHDVAQRIIDTYRAEKNKTSEPTSPPVSPDRFVIPKLSSPKIAVRTPVLPGKVTKRSHFTTVMRSKPVLPESYNGLGGHSRNIDLNTNFKVVTSRSLFKPLKK